MSNQPLNLRSSELVRLAKEINEREELILSLKRQTFDGMAKWLAEAALQGEALNRAKKALGHGRWLEWLKIHCPFAHDTASRYIHASEDFARERNLNPDLSLLEIAAKLIRERRKEKEDQSSLPPYLEALGRVTKLVGYIDKHPLAGWPTEGKEKLREDLRPIVTELGGTV